MKLIKIANPMVMLLVALSFVACSDNETGKVQAAEKSGEYSTQYSFSTISLDGADLKLEDYKGKVVIVDLWDTWCPPCQMEIPHFIDLYNEYQDKGFVMIGLAFGQEGQQAVEKFVKDFGINYLNGYVNEDVIAKLGRPQGIPTTFVFDQSGNIYKKYTGYRDKSIFESDIKALLSASI